MKSEPIVGAKFRPPAVGLLKVLPSGAKLLVRREPENAYDVNALQVILSITEELNSHALDHTDAWDEVLNGFGYSVMGVLMEHEWHLGYVPRERAAEYAPMFDAQGVKEVPGALAMSATGLPRVQFEVP